MFCNNCGHQNPLGSNFCSSCGAVLDAASGEPTTVTMQLDMVAGDDGITVDRPAGGGDALLIVKRGPNAGSRFAVDKDLTSAGRHPDSDIFLDDVTVSRRHAELIRDGEAFRVRDVGSLNGTYLNRERINDAPLHGGDELQIGKFKLVFLESAD